MKKFRNILFIILGILIVLFLAGAVVLRHVPASTYVVEDVDTTSHWGVISGSLSYPSDFIPAQGICAISKDKMEEYCTYEMLEEDSYKNGYGYKISVPPGSYNVFAYEVTEANSEKGYQEGDYLSYYSKFVTCDYKTTCTSHRAILVAVEPNEDVTGIDPGDWYNF